VTDIWWRMAAAKELKDRAEDYYDAVKAEAKSEQGMARGDRKRVYAPDGHTKLGTASMSDPKRTAQVTDVGAFVEWVRANYPKSIEMDADIIGPDDEVKAALFLHAPHLVKPRDRVSSQLRAAVLEASNLAGVVVGPGGELDVAGVAFGEASQSRVSFLPDDDAGPVVAKMVRSGVVTLPDLFDEPDAEPAAEAAE